MPISLPDKGIPLTRHTRIYHIRRTEDARVRYRLRLGPFMTEAQANAVLGLVREGYPAAFTAAAIQEDLESVADIQFEAITAPASAPSASAPKPVAPEVAAPKPVAAVQPPPTAKVEPRPENRAPAAKAIPVLTAPPPAAPMPPVVAAKVQPTAKVEPRPENRIPAAPAKPAAPIAARPQVAASAPVQAAAPQKAGVSATTNAVPPKRPAAAAPPASTVKSDAQEKRLSMNTPPLLPTAAENLKAEALTLAPDFTPPPAASGSATLAHQVSSLLTSMILELEPDDKPRTDKSKVAELPHRQAPTTLRLTVEEDESVDLESTQTMRALTTAELAHDNKMSQWFAIELSVADRPFDPDAVPDLDIFSAYRLYVIESKGKAGAIHALRLGFFGEQTAAQAVADYLKDHYQRPNVMRVSIAERERFSERRVQARKKVEATGKHAAIEITDQRYIRELSLIER